MKNLLAAGLGWIRGNRLGFTLVEMLVVVAIIVALAAVIVPTVTVLLDQGEEGAQEAELSSLQAAMDALMASNGVPAVTAGGTLGAPISDLVGDLVGDGTANDNSLNNYFRETTSTYCYHWDTDGLLIQSETFHVDPTDPAACIAGAP